MSEQMSPGEVLSENDVALVHRFVDGDLDDHEIQMFVDRMEKEAALQTEVERLEKLRGVLGAYANELRATAQDPSKALEGARGRIGRPSQAEVIPIQARSKKRSNVIPIVASFAVAAGVLMIVLPWFMRRPHPGQHHRRGSDVVSVDFGANAGTVFQVRNGESRVAVVWIEENK